MRTAGARAVFVTKAALFGALLAHVAAAAASTPQLKSSVAPGHAKLTPVTAPQSVSMRDSGAAAEIMFENIGLSGAETGADELEMTLRFDGPLDGAHAEKVAAALPRWITYATPGYDSLLIRTRKRAAFGVTRGGTGFTLRISWAADPNAASRENMQRLRYLTMTGETERARALLGDLRKLPSEGDRLDRAEAELRVAERDLRGGLAAYERLSIANPDDLTLRRAAQDLRWQLSDVAQIGILRQSVEDGDDQTRVTLRGRADIGPTTALTGDIETVTLTDDALLRSDGAIIPFDETRARLRASYDVNSGRGMAWTATLHAGAPGIGLGGEVAWRSARQEIALRASYNEPFFGFVESIVNDGTRDAVEASLLLRGTRRWSAGATVGFDRYALDRVDEAASAVVLAAFVRYETPISDQWSVILSYALDADYVIDVATALDASSVPFTPLPLVDREVHELGLGLAAQWDDGLSIDAMAGYAIDRYAEGGVFARVNLDYALSDAWRAYANAAYTEVNTRGTGGGAVTSGGLGLAYKFGAPGAVFRGARQGAGL